MSKTTALPLTQQVQAWILQSMGYFDDLKDLSRSTAKSALRGDTIQKRWSTLTDEVLRGLRLSFPTDQTDALRAALRDLDQRTSALSDHGLSTGDPLPVVLQLLLPHLGVRLGVLAAMLDHGSGDLSDDARATLTDALCDPLSPRLFGCLLEALFQQHHPHLTTWEQRIDALAEAKAGSKSAVEGWRKRQVRVPAHKKLPAIAALMGSPQEQERALLLLRVSRLATRFRESVGEWADEMLAEDAERLVAPWATETRRLLGEAQTLPFLAEGVVEALEGERGAEMMPGLAPWLGEGIPALSPEQVAVEIHQDIDAVRSGEAPDALRWLLPMQLFRPLPPLVGMVGTQLGATGAVHTWIADPLPLIQRSWQTTVFLQRIVSGRSLQWVGPSGTHEVIPTPDLQMKARRLLAMQRQLTRSPEDTRSIAEPLSLMAALLPEQAGPELLAESWNAAMAMFTLPAAAEPALSDAVVAQAPHLAPHRALRLEEAGQSREAMVWLNRWADSPAPKPWPERLAAAKTTLSRSHRSLKKTIKVREQSTTLLESLASLLSAIGESQNVLARSLETHEKLYTLASQLLSVPPSATERVERIVLLFPLALRLDSLRFDLAVLSLEDLNEDGDIEFPLAESLIEELTEAIQHHPTHAGAWAALAVWKMLQEDEDVEFTQKQAVHFGGTSHLEDLLALLSEEDLLE